MAYGNKRQGFDQAILDQKFNKSLVTRQVKALNPDMKTEELYRITDNIRHEWELTNKLAEYRPRFFKSKYHPGIIVTSTHSTSYDASIQYEQINIDYKGSMFFAVPIPAYLVIAMGGPLAISKIISIGGLRLFLEMLKKNENVDLDLMSPSIFSFLNQYITDLEKDLEG